MLPRYFPAHTGSQHEPGVILVDVQAGVLNVIVWRLKIHPHTHTTSFCLCVEYSCAALNAVKVEESEESIYLLSKLVSPFSKQAVCEHLVQADSKF